MSNEIELSAFRVMAETGMTAAELNALSMDEFARLTGRATFAETAVRSLGYDEIPGRPRQHTESTPVQVASPEPEPIDIANMSYAEYAEFRAANGIGQGDRGIFFGTGSQAFIEAAKSKPGRSAMQGRNVDSGPRIGRQFVRDERLIDQRPSSERFSNASNVYGQRAGW